jgi:ketosteroid isomerase-like protein
LEVYSPRRDETERITTKEGEKDLSLIETLLKSYEAALNTSDVDAAMNCYGKNPVFMPPNLQAIVGRDAVRRAYDQASKSSRRLSEHFTIHEVETIGDIGWARVTSAVRISNVATGSETKAGSNQLYILRRENGEWKIHCYMFSASRPPAAIS